MEIKKFMIIDMLIFTFIALISEWLGSKINKDLLYLSFSQILILLMIIRWEGFASIPTIIIALLRPVIFQAQGLNEYIIYSVPVLVLLFALIPVKLNVLKDINKNRYIATLYFIIFYLTFYISNGILIKILISSDYSMINDFIKYLLIFIVGIIVYYLLVSQKTMLINIRKTAEKNEKDREENDNN